MKGVGLVLKKEFLELFKDRKTLLLTFLLPLLLYPVMFGMIGQLGRKDTQRIAGQPSRVLLVDPQNLIKPALQADPGRFSLVERPKGDLRQALRDQQLELAVEVEPAAAAKMARGETYVLDVQLDTSERASSEALKRLKEALKVQDQATVQARLRALDASPELAVPTKIHEVDASDKALQAGKLLGALLPYLLMIMMFTGSMQHGIYVSAGEKERGTLASLLATRLPRQQIIWGKLLYVFIMGLVAVVLNLASMGFSVAKLLPDDHAKAPEAHVQTVQTAQTGKTGKTDRSGQAEAPAHRASSSAAEAPADPAAKQAKGSDLSALANPATLALCFLLLLPLGLAFSSFILFMGVQAKNTAEAGTSLMPGVMGIVLLGGFSLAPGIEKMAWLPYVPILNVSLAIRKLFSQQGDPLQYCIALAMTLALSAIMVWISTRVISRESALFKV